MAAIAWLLATTLVAGCSFNARRGADDLLAAPQQPAESSPLRLRQLQTREYGTGNGSLVMRAVIGSLQDEGFVVTSADAQLGLVNARLEAPHDESRSRRDQRRYWFAAGEPGGSAVTRLDAAITVTPLGETTRVRLGFVSRIADAGGGLRTYTVEDPEIYRSMFSRLDRAVFYELQRL